MKIAVTGSSGLIGSALGEHLAERGHEVVRVVRPQSAAAGAIRWDPAAGSIDPADLAGTGAVVNLSGRSIGEKRWSGREKEALRSSRLDPTATLVEALLRLDAMPALINSSAIGYYGDRGDERLDENAGPGRGFLAELCVDWEAATRPITEAGGRVVTLRTGIVLSADGGALGRMLRPFPWAPFFRPYAWGLAGRLGKGDQWWSWVSLADEVAAITHLVEGDLSGPVNLTAPEPATNAEFIRALGGVLRRIAPVPVPRFVLDIVLGRELAGALLFDSTRALPTRLLEDGFTFSEPDLDGALRRALDR
jgi:uncharacterized protein (TIGR01777 family)